MRVAHVVTYISPDGAFGGPVRVALAQAKVLAEHGHDVTVFAASPDPGARDSLQDGYRLRTFPARRLARRLGFAGMYAPGLTTALRTQLPSLDVVHVHMARDLVTLPAARAVRRAGVPLVVQPHGMIDRSTNPLSVPIDAWEVRPALRGAAAVLVLTDEEAANIREISPGAGVARIANGIEFDALPPYDGRARTVLFLARLHPRKRASAFVEMARTLLDRGCDLDFVLAGPDEGEGEVVESMIREADRGEQIKWLGAVAPDETDRLLRNSVAYVLPAVGEVFPMAILEAFRAGTPVVATTSLGIAEMCAGYDAALVTDGSPAALADAVERITADLNTAESLRQGAMRLLESELSMDAVADTLLSSYADAVVDLQGGGR